MNDIDRWIRQGAEVNEGLRLLGIYAPNRWLDELVRKAPRFRYLLEEKLKAFADCTAQNNSLSSLSLSQEYGNNFRKKWPFLGDTDCPAELKILAADMITAWHDFVDEHENLYSCTTPETCYDTAERVIKSFTQNRNIRSEFAYYKEHHSVLGKHPIFGAVKRREALQKMTVSELFRRQKNLIGAIWRVKSEMKKNDRPDLKIQREERLRMKENELEEVNRIIESYNGRKQ